MRIRFFSICIVFLFFLTSCSVTKFVPEGEHLLDKVEIKSDNKTLQKEELKRYLRQAPNSSVFGFWRMQLRLYSTAGKDTTKRVNRLLMRSGEAPVIYDENQTYLSEQSLQKALQNKGYMHAKVDSDVEFNKRKARVTYHIKENEPYRLRNYEVDLPDEELNSVASDSVNSLVKKDMLFDVDVLNAERDRVTKTLRQRGYYRFSKDLIYYPADSAFSSNQVDVTMKLIEFDEQISDSIQDVILKKYIIRNVIFFSSPNITSLSYRAPVNRDDYSVERDENYMMVYEDEKFLKMNTLIDNTFILPHNYYNETMVEKTYTALNALPPVKYVNINFREVAGTDSLDCMVTVAPAKLLSLNADIEATLTEKFWGVAGSLGTTQRNVFKGAESLSLQGRLAYEWQQPAVASEWGLQAGLLFPKFLMPFTTSELRRRIRANTEFTTSISRQKRPEEFNVSNLNAGMKYQWVHTRYRHTLELIDLSFIDFTIDQNFWDNYIESNKLNKHSYEDHLIMRIGYSGSFSTYNINRPLRNYISMRYGVETAGNLLYGINKTFGGVMNTDGTYYTIFNIPYSQYVRGDYNVSYHNIIDENNRFVYHFGIGVGTPYGNANVIPYERRYYSGGANSVRGWSEGTLGPGAYATPEAEQRRRRRDYNQVGDIKLDLNAEYRYKMFRSLNGAIFVDAGNIWTAKPYESQPGGEFKFNSFLEQIALSYGLGLRLDLSFVVIRLDMGIRLYDPSLLKDERWRGKLTSNDFAVHFAIGYPF